MTGPVQRRLLSALRLYEGTWISAGDLTYLVYDQDTPRRRNNLHVLIWNVRNRCPELEIETRYGNRAHGAGGYRPVRVPAS